MLTSQTETVQSIEYGVEEAEVENGYQYDPASDSLPAIDLTLAAQYITALTGSLDTPVTWQVFRDDANVESVASNWTATLAAAIPELIRLNKAGQGIFVTVSETDLKGRSKANCIAPRALFLDFDDKHGEFIDEDKLRLLPKPSAKIRSGGGYHLYWFLKPDEPLDALEPALGQLIQYMGGDTKCKDMSRVMRVPGFLHQKAKKNEKPNPFLVTICYSNPEIRYSIAEVVAGIPGVSSTGASTRNSKKSNTLSLPSGKNKGDFDSKLAKLVADIKDAPNGSRNHTINKGVFSLAGQFPDKLDAIETAVLQVCEDCGDDMVNVKSALKGALISGAAKPFTPHGGDGDLMKLLPIDAADLLVSEVLTNIKFDTHTSQWWEYDGKGKWYPVKQSRVFKLCQDYLRDKVKITTINYLNDCIRFAQSHVQVDGWSEASSLMFIPFTNGVLDIKANHFGEHSSDYGFTWQLPRAYEPLATDWTQIDRFLDVLSNNNPGLKKLAIAFCNAVLKGRSDLQKFLYLFGGGGNGKGAFMILLSMLIGKENIHSSNMSELNGNRFESANLKGKRLLLMSDEDKRSGGVGVFKAATGGDSIRFEQKGKDASHFIFTGMVVVAANSPTFAGTSDGGIKRRKVDFPCKSFVQEMDRKDMSPLFDADLTAFTSYLLSLDDAWVTETIRKASDIEAVKELGRELAIREDSVAAFADAIEITANPGKKVAGLYTAYSDFCKLNGLKPKSAVNFTPNFIECCKAEGIEVTNKRDNKGKYLLGLTVVLPKIED